MYKRRISFAVTAIVSLILLVMSFAAVTYSAQTRMVAAADYEFNFIDEEDASEDYDIGDYESGIIEFSTDENNYNSIVYQEANVRETSFNPIKAFIISLIIGLIVAFIAVSIMKSSMKSVYKKQGASDYRKQNSFELKVKTDTPLGSRIEKSPVMRVENTSQRSPKN